MTTAKQPAAHPLRSIDMRYLEGTVGYTIRRAQMAVFQNIYECFGERSITLVQFSVLAVAADNPGVTQSELAEVLAVERPRMVPIINKLEELGLAQRIVSEQDKRNRKIALTPKGKSLLIELKQRFAIHEKQLDAQLGKRKADLLGNLQALSQLGSKG
ncbi:MAG: MarR family winged helix-turn-helix transcriptional regulator [Burkholderiales bacterium]|jgi:DNA-binding MarR family transcriptional regulator